MWFDCEYKQNSRYSRRIIFIKTSNCEKLPGIKTDCKLAFDNHVNNLYKKANNKMRASAKSTPCTHIEKRKFQITPFSTLNIDVAILIKSNIYSRDI